MTWVDYLAFDCVLYCKPHCALYCAFYCISYCEYLRLTGRASQGLVVVVIRPCYTCQRTGYNTAFASPFLMLFFPSFRNTVTSRQHHLSITTPSHSDIRQHHVHQTQPQTSPQHSTAPLTPPRRSIPQYPRYNALTAPKTPHTAPQNCTLQHPIFPTMTSQRCITHQQCP